MISIASLNSSKDLVALLADKAVTLKAIGGSPVEEAMIATKIYGGSISCLTEIDLLPERIYRPNELVVANGSVEIDAHSAYLDTASAAIGLQLASHIAHAMNVVLPTIGECYAAIEKARDAEGANGVQSYKVEMSKSSSLFDVGDIVSSIEEFATIEAVRELPLVLDFEEMGVEDVVKLMMIGSSTYDAAIADFVADAGQETIADVWRTVFCNANPSVKDYDQYRADRNMGNTRNWATFLIAKNLLLKVDALPPVTGAAGFSKGKYGVALRQLVEVTGRALAIQVATVAGNERVGMLFETVSGKTIYVNKSVFDRFMADGGDIEIILGAVVTEQTHLSAKQLAEQTEKLKAAWSYYYNRSLMSAKTNELTNVRLAIANFVRRAVATTEDQVVIDNRDKIVNETDKYVEAIFLPALEDIPTLALNVVCDLMFDHTKAGDLLRGVNSAMAYNKDVSKEDALNLAVVDYVADWYASQIVIDA